MKKYLFVALALLLVLMAGSVLNVYAEEIAPSSGNINPDGIITVINPSPTPVTYYPDYDEEEDEPAAPAPVEEASPKTGDTAVTAAAMLLGIGAAAVVVTCVRKSRA